MTTAIDTELLRFYVLEDVVDSLPEDEHELAVATSIVAAMSPHELREYAHDHFDEWAD
jgi:hypothetical protein